MKQLMLSLAVLLLSVAGNAQSPASDSTATLVTDSSEFYGLIPQRPIKVGGNFTSGVANQHKYLRALRDAQGESVSYNRLGSCCAYATKNGFDGYGLLDKYEVAYRDKDNNKKKVVLYISFYDFEDPKAVKGFTLENLNIKD